MVFFEGLKPAFRARLCYNKIVREGLYHQFEFAPPLLKPLTRDPDQTKNVKAAPIYPWRPFVFVIPFVLPTLAKRNYPSPFNAITAQ
jgi:hypothetical protein